MLLDVLPIGNHSGDLVTQPWQAGGDGCGCSASGEIDGNGHGVDDSVNTDTNQPIDRLPKGGGWGLLNGDGITPYATDTRLGVW